jgi:glycosyltransferase involved in cell wall biosynthesis
VKRRKKILIDFEESFNSYTGIPLSTVNDALCIINSEFDVILWYSDKMKTSRIESWMEEYLSKEQRGRVVLLPSRPNNLIMWFAPLIPRQFRQAIDTDYAYSRLFPYLPIKGNTICILRIDDPFGVSKSWLKTFANGVVSGAGLKNALAKSMRTFAYSMMNHAKTIKIFNSSYTRKLWYSVYGHESDIDQVIYPPVQFSVEDFVFGEQKVEKMANQRKYFVIIGGQRQRKDPLSIIRVWASDLTQSDFDLFVVGKVDKKDFTQPVSKALDESRLIFKQNLSSLELRSLIQHSSGLIFNSKGEGFGNPIAEGIYLGVPVICNSLDVFKEVGGTDAFYYDNEDYEAALKLMQSLSSYKNQSVRNSEQQYAMQHAIKQWYKALN